VAFGNLICLASMVTAELERAMLVDELRLPRFSDPVQDWETYMRCLVLAPLMKSLCLLAVELSLGAIAAVPELDLLVLRMAAVHSLSSAGTHLVDLAQCRLNTHAHSSVLKVVEPAQLDASPSHPSADKRDG